MALGVIVGTGLRGVELPHPRGVVLLQRHGLDSYTPPHRIDHAANLRVLADRGCDRVLALSSVGALRREIAVGAFICPSDFIALHIGRSAFDDDRGHRVPGFDAGWRREVIAAWGEAGAPPLAEGGVYWEAIGPRFETPAEIRLIATHADVIGMTVASECVIAGELGLRYAAVCVVDNLANGLDTAPLSEEEFRAGLESNREVLADALLTVVPRLAAEE